MSQLWQPQSWPIFNSFVQQTTLKYIHHYNNPMMATAIADSMLAWTLFPTITKYQCQQPEDITFGGDSMNDLCTSLQLSLSHSSNASACYMDLHRTWSFSIRIFVVMARPTLIFGTRYQPSLNDHPNMTPLYSRHHPFEPLYLREQAYVGCLSRRNHLGNYHIQFEMPCTVFD